MTSFDDNKADVAFSSSASSTGGDGQLYQYSRDSPLMAYQYPLLVWLLTIVYILILATSVVANLITISYYFMNRNSQLIANPYVLSLVTADLIWPLLNVPLNVVYAWTPFWQFGQLACHLMPYFQVIFPEIISFTLCAIAAERYFTIIHPFRRNPMLSPAAAALTLCCIWLLPMLGNSFLIAAHSLEKLGNSSNSPAMCVPSNYWLALLSPQQLTTFKIVQSAIVLVCIPGVLFPFCYGRIVFRVIRSQLKLSSRASMPSSSFTEVRSTTATINDETGGSTFRNSNNSPINNNKNSAKKLSSAISENSGNSNRSTPEQRTRIVTMISILGQLAHFTCWTPIVAFQLWHVANDYPPLSARQVVVFKVLTLLASANPVWNSLSYTAILRHRWSHPHHHTRRAASVNASAFNLLSMMVKSNNTTNNNGRSVGSSSQQNHHHARKKGKNNIKTMETSFCRGRTHTASINSSSYNFSNDNNITTTMANGTTRAAARNQRRSEQSAQLSKMRMTNCDISYNMNIADFKRPLDRKNYSNNSSNNNTNNNDSIVAVSSPTAASPPATMAEASH